MVNIASVLAPAAVFNVLPEIAKVSTTIYKRQDVQHRLKESKLFKNITIEASSEGENLLNTDRMPKNLGLNGFAEAIHLAYDQHHGLALYPDHIFITILQGLTIHVSTDPEKYRSALGLGHTKAGSKENISVRRDNFILGSLNNDWEGVFPEFSKEIGKRVSGDVHVLLSSPYSTSTPLSTAVTSLTIMDVFKNYYSYSVSTMCGIPDIALMGSKKDWQNVLSRTKKLFKKFDDLGFWEDQLIPVLENFVLASSNKDYIDKKFWSSIYKPGGGSGGPFIRGWINTFVPYLQTKEKFIKNKYIDWKVDYGSFSGLIYNDIPSGFTKTPFTWNYYQQSLPMEFLGGFLGVEEVKSNNLQGFVAPSLGWAVLHSQKKEKRPICLQES